MPSMNGPPRLDRARNKQLRSRTHTRSSTSTSPSHSPLTPTRVLPSTAGRGLLDLPNELLTMIMSRSCPQSVLALRATNRRLRDVFSADSRRIIPRVLTRGNDIQFIAAHCIDNAVVSHFNIPQHPLGCSCNGRGRNVHGYCANADAPLHPPRFRELKVAFRIRSIAEDKAWSFLSTSVPPQILLPPGPTILILVHMFLWLYSIISRSRTLQSHTRDIVTAIKAQDSEAGELLSRLIRNARINSHVFHTITFGPWSDPVRSQQLMQQGIHQWGYLRLFHLDTSQPGSILRQSQYAHPIPRLESPLVLFFRAWIERR